MTRRKGSEMDLECLARALDGVRSSTTPEEKLRAARLFAAKVEEAKPALTEEQIVELRGGVAEIAAEVRQASQSLQDQIASTAKRLENLRAVAKLKVGGFGPGNTNSKV
ncbi:MAG: hypothetical protein HY049_04860 [Acidobacteria bacterium]|nr:hypothetical protein [Acidobacteriota bacterium]